MWYEDVYKIQLDNHYNYLLLIRKTQFERQFRDILFDDLIEQNKNILTNDGCLYYRHKETGIVYSWNSFKNEWNEKSLDLVLFSKLFPN